MGEPGFVNNPRGYRKKRKFAGESCYFCADRAPVGNEDIPGKLFGVTAQTGGLLVPACQHCNGPWSADQEHVRLRVTLHAGSADGAAYIKSRERGRISGTGQRAPQVERYMRERSKQYFVNGRESLGLTEDDDAGFSNVLRHWAAGVHYWKQKTRAALPGSLHFKWRSPDIFRSLSLPPQPHGEWKLKGGAKFGSWWFCPGPNTSESVTIFNLLRSDELWFLVRFPMT